MLRAEPVACFIAPLQETKALDVTSLISDENTCNVAADASILEKLNSNCRRQQ